MPSPSKQQGEETGNLPSREKGKGGGPGFRAWGKVRYWKKKHFCQKSTREGENRKNRSFTGVHHFTWEETRGCGRSERTGPKREPTGGVLRGVAEGFERIRKQATFPNKHKGGEMGPVAENLETTKTILVRRSQEKSKNLEGHRNKGGGGGLVALCVDWFKRIVAIHLEERP